MYLFFFVSDEFCRYRHITDFCRGRYPKIESMAIWLSEHEQLLSSPQILPRVLTSIDRDQLDDIIRNEEMLSNPASSGLYFADEIDDINSQTDAMLFTQLKGRLDSVY